LLGLAKDIDWQKPLDPERKIYNKLLWEKVDSKKEETEVKKNQKKTSTKK
jgi:hypothetical protein